MIVSIPENRGLGVSATDSLKAQGIALAIKYLTGEMPAVVDHVDYVEIVLSRAQVEKTHNLLDDWNKDKGKIRINTGDVVFPYLIKKYWPWAAALTLGAVLLGRATK